MFPVWLPKSASDLSYDSLLIKFGNHTGNIISASDLSYDSLLIRFGNHTENIISASDLSYDSLLIRFGNHTGNIDIMFPVWLPNLMSKES
jgi:hypothetical protein